MKLKKKRNIYLLIVFVVALVIGIGYAILSSSLNIAGSTNIKDNTWDVHFENINVTTGSVEAITPTISNGTNITYTATLVEPKDYYEFTVDVKNSGSIDAMIENISNTGLTSEQKKYMEYNATYDSGVDISEKQELKANSKEKIRVTVRYKDDINASDLPTEAKTINLTLIINYAQANNTAIEVNHSTCRRATTLHTEICTNTEEYACAYSGSQYSGGYSSGDKIEYGNYGTKGTLTSGDAFDCDVNGDGSYNSSTERFYYVSALDTNANYGVLIYYSNVSAGQPNSNTAYEYDSNDNPRENGPITLLPQLPTTSGWKNVSLYNTTRKIKDQNHTEYADFSYSGYASRLLTVQEIESACNISVGTYTTGELDTCRYLLENSDYSSSSLLDGWWLENVLSYNAAYVWSVRGHGRRVNDSNASSSSSRGVRPAIEVPKSKINY